MKIFISADIEGITGTTHWDETDAKYPDYSEFREQMTAEVVAASEGALAAGATEIWVKDAHGSARNLIATRLPPEVKLVRGWSGHPYCMVDGIDPTFQAMLLVGYHSRAGSGANPLAHTMTGSNTYVKINERFASEFLINTYTAASVRVPTIFVAGDAGLCEEAASVVPAIGSVAVKQGVGGSTINIQPHLAVQKIREGVQKALEGDVPKCLIELPERFRVEIGYKEQDKAYRMSFFPGAQLKDTHTLQFEADNYFDVLRLFMFVL